MIYKDKFGNEFASFSEMCNFHQGENLQDFIAPVGNTPDAIYDHLGNKFPSQAAMCAYYKIPYEIFAARRYRGDSMEKALTQPVRSRTKKVVDHLGNKYNSIDEMCKAYNTTYKRYYEKLRRGYTMEQALSTTRKKRTEAVKGKACKDHLGNEYISIAAMCKAYNIDPKRYHSLIKAGHTMEELLTHQPIRTYDSGECTDHLGNVFKNKKVMAEHYNIPYKTLLHRLYEKWPLESALTFPLHTTINGTKMKVKNVFNKDEILQEKFQKAEPAKVSERNYSVEEENALIDLAKQTEHILIG